MKIFAGTLIAATLLFSQAIFAGTAELKLKQNGQIDFSAYRGNVVYLDFWASWCEPCRESFAWMNDIHEQYQGKKFKIIAVNLDTNKDDARVFLDQVPAKFDIAYDPDGTTAQAYKLKGMPTSFLIDSKGRIAAEKVGFKFSETKKLESKIRELVK